MTPSEKEQYEVNSTEKMSEIADQHIAGRISVFLSSDTVPITFETKIISLSDNKLSLINTIVPCYIKDFMKSTRFSLLMNEHRLSTDRILSDGKYIQILIPESFDNGNLREEERLICTDHEDYFCEFTNPIDQITVLKKPIIDLSKSGLSIKNNAEKYLFYPGIQLSGLRIFIHNKLRGVHNGHIVYQRQLLNIRGYMSVQIGIKFL